MRCASHVATLAVISSACGRLGFDPTGGGAIDSNGGSSATVRVELTGDGGGRVTSTPAGIDCPGLCEFEFAIGTVVTLSAEPQASRHTFQGWAGGCDGPDACSVIAAAPAVAVTTYFAGLRNLVFVTSTAVDPVALAGLAPADAICEQRANAAGLPGSYVAWISSTTVRAVDRVAGRGWLRMDGRPFADTTADLISERVFYPVNYYETGAPVVPARGMITGTPSGGSAAALADTCNDWTTNGGSVGLGRTDGAGAAFSLFVRAAPCSAGGWCLLCLGVSETAPVSLVPATGTRAFVVSSWPVGGGLAGADQACQAAADAAGVAGVFRALLAAPGQSAASRFALDRPRWVRPDGVPILPDRAALVERIDLDTGITQTADGTPMTLEVWLGAVDRNTPGSSASTCSGWTGTTGTGRSGFAGYSSQDFTRDMSCALVFGLICLEE